MPFFPQTYLSPEASFFQLLSELDQPQRKSCAPRQHRPQTFTPRFDVQEVEGAYELYGELPGIEQENITIEFADAQTLVIKGKTERAAAKNPAPQSQETVTEPEKTESHNPTVEDEYDEADTPLAAPATTATVTEDTPAETTETPQAPKPKYWVAERRVGEFARSFSFAQHIEQDAVSASLKNGILRVTVPKTQKKGKAVVNVL